MADIALVTEGRLGIAAEKLDVASQLTSIAEEAIDAGEVVSLDATTGKFQLADADVEATRDECYIALRSVLAGEALTASKNCVVTGFSISGNFGSPIYLSNTAGKMSTTAASPGNSFVVGRVVPIFGNGVTADRGIRFCSL